MAEDFSKWYNGAPVLSFGSETGHFDFWYNGRPILKPSSVNLPVGNSLSSVLASLTVSASNQISSNLANSADLVLALTLAGSNEVSSNAGNSADLVLANLTLTGTSSVSDNIAGLVDCIFGSLSLSGAISVGAFTENSLDAVLGVLSLSGSDGIAAENSADLLLGALTLDASNGVAVSVQVDALLEVLGFSATNHTEPTTVLNGDLFLGLVFRSTNSLPLCNKSRVPRAGHEATFAVPTNTCRAPSTPLLGAGSESRFTAPTNQCRTPAISVLGAGRQKIYLPGQPVCLPQSLLGPPDIFNTVTLTLDGLVLETDIPTTVTTPPLVFTYTDCADEFSFNVSVPTGEVWKLQISSDESTWGDHVFIDGNGAEQSITLNNDYEGSYFFRLLNADGIVVRASAKPAASTVPAPLLDSITNVVDIHLDRPLRSSNGYTYPYSSRENAYISPTTKYLVPRGRYLLEFDGDLSVFRLPNIVTVTGVDGAVNKWTREGNDPTILTEIARLDGYDNNAAAYRDDFGLILKIRSFLGGCKSPVTCVLVDKRLDILKDFESFGAGQVVGGYCDLPQPPDGFETAYSCNLVYGGTTGFDDRLKLIAQGELASTHNGRVVWSQQENVSTSTYIGFPIHKNSWSLYYHETSSIVRNPVVRRMPPAYTYAKALTSNAIVPVELSAGLFGSAFGSSGELEGRLTSYIFSQFPDDSSLLTVSLTILAPLFTLHNDSAFFRDPEFDPPVGHPVDPPYHPSVSIYGDDFEAYLDGDATAEVLNQGTGWVGDWTVIAYTPTIGEDTFGSYADGDVSTQTLDGGTLWNDSWTVVGYFSDRVGEDDMQSYSDGVIGHSILTGGSGWAEDWSVLDYSVYRSGSDNMQSYSDGAVASGVSSMTGGEGWVASLSWVFPI